MATVDGGTIKSFQSHIEDMRSLTLCKICLKPFYEPYILACGHTYCYSCLRSWFGRPENHKKKNCPDCRTIVKVQPAPNYLLRDLVHMFIGRVELLPEDEAVEEHTRDKNIEAQLMTSDRNGRGLFQGVFKNVPGPRYPQQFLQDMEDNVLRCPECMWELEDGQCGHCGSDLRDWENGLSGSESESGSDLGSVSSIETGDEAIPRFYGAGIDLGSDDDDESSIPDQEPNEYDQQDDFVDDEEIDDDGMDEVDDVHGYRSDAATPYSEGHSPVQNDEDDEPVRRFGRPQQMSGAFDFNNPSSQEWMWNFNPGSRSPQPQSPPPPLIHFHSPDVGVGSSNSISDEEDEDNVRPMTRASRRRPVVVDNDDEEEEDDNQNEHEEGNLDATSEISFDHDITHQPNNGFSSAEESSEADSDSQDDSEEDASSSSEEDDSEVSDSDSSSDETVTPQSGPIRRQHLQNQRARRGGHSVSTDTARPANVRISGPHTNRRRSRPTTTVH